MENKDIKMNGLMAAIFPHGQKPVQLAPRLAAFAAGGFVMHEGGIYLISFFDGFVIPQWEIDKGYFPDVVAREARINQLDVESFVKRNRLRQALAFIDACEQQPRPKSVVRYSISINKFKSTSHVKLRMHGIREGERPYLLDDLEGYNQPVLTVTSQK